MTPATPPAVGTRAVDEVSVLRDAHWLGVQGTDLCPTGADLPVARKLEAAGILEISVAGRILAKPCYRVAPGSLSLAEECHRVVEAERDELRHRLALAVAMATAVRG